MLQPHIKIEKAEKYVLLSGDPSRSKMISEKFLENSELIVDNRGLPIYRGYYKNIPIMAATSGMGCPSASIVVEELINCGAKIIIRIGTCGGLLKEMEPGDLIIPNAAMCFDGTTKEYDSKIEKINSDKEISKALISSAKKQNLKYFIGINRTHDAFYEPMENFVKLAGKGLISSEMECSIVFLVSSLRGMKSGAILTVNTPEPPEEVLKDPNVIYKLVDKEKVMKGVENSVKVALEAIKLLVENKE